MHESRRATFVRLEQSALRRPVPMLVPVKWRYSRGCDGKERDGVGNLETAVDLHLRWVRAAELGRRQM
jgi:hypothetical protein